MQDRLSPLEILDRLIAFPTVSRDSNLPLIDWVQDYLQGQGITCGRVPAACGRKAGLYAHAGPWLPGGVILSGHSDVVPVDGQDWGSDPFRLDLRDGRLYGRGTADMKGFVALAIWALVEAQHAGVSRPLQLALSHDEEIGCFGAPPLIAAMGRALPRASAVLVGEPTMLQVVTGHKGGVAYDTTVTGVEVHSSRLHQGVNAVMAAAPLIDWANRVNADSAAARPSQMAALFDPPWTSAHVGQVAGGTAHNITAGQCRFAMDFRVVPGESPETWRDRWIALTDRARAGLKARHHGADITVTERFRVPPLAPEPQGAAEELARALTGDNGGHVVSYATEAGQFQEAGYSAVVCGPGDIAQAHQADEYLTLAQFQAGQALLERLLTRLGADVGAPAQDNPAVPAAHT